MPRIKSCMRQAINRKRSKDTPATVPPTPTGNFFERIKRTFKRNLCAELAKHSVVNVPKTCSPSFCSYLMIGCPTGWTSSDLRGKCGSTRSFVLFINPRFAKTFKPRLYLFPFKSGLPQNTLIICPRPPNRSLNFDVTTGGYTRDLKPTGLCAMVHRNQINWSNKCVSDKSPRVRNSPGKSPRNRKPRRAGADDWWFLAASTYPGMYVGAGEEFFFLMSGCVFEQKESDMEQNHYVA